MINRTKAFRFILLVALPLLVVNIMGRNIGVGKEDMIKEDFHSMCQEDDAKNARVRESRL